MGMSAQDKMLQVASRLGLTSLKDMQGTTRMVYDSIALNPVNAFTFFKGAAQRAFPFTNVGSNGNQFQVDEALLIEKIAFFTPSDNGAGYSALGSRAVKFSLIIGNKTVIKDVTVESGGQQAFYVDGVNSHVIDLEGAGILIPPQVEYYVTAEVFVGSTRILEAAPLSLGCYLFGTGALLNFNTTI